MSSIKGTNVSAPIVPFDTNDRFGTHDAKYGIGGYRSVPTIYDRDAIPEERLAQGMRVRVTNDSFSTNNVDWDYIDRQWVRAVTVVQAEAARDAAIAAKNEAEAAADASQLSAGVYPTTADGLAATTDGQYFNIPSDNDDEYLILYQNVAGSAVEIKRYPSAALVESLIYATPRTFYVTMTGDDNNAGTSLRTPLATIKKALEKATNLSAPCVIIVHPGEYFVEPDSVIPPNCALYGYDLRVTKLILARGTGLPEDQAATKGRNMFQMSNGIKVRGFTFSNLEHEDPPEYPGPYNTPEEGVSATNFTSGEYIPNTNVLSYIRPKYFKAYDANGDVKLYFNNKGKADLVDHDYPPEGGFVFVFKPGEYITRSPYIGDCSYLHNFSYEQLTAPINRSENNPRVPRGGGNLRADGSILNLNSPLRSVVVDSFTSINPNGYAYLITRGALVQLVSVFTNWSRIGVWSHQGGQVTIANSNTTFGDYSLASTGYRHMIRVPEADSTLYSLGTFEQAGLELEKVDVSDQIAAALQEFLTNDTTVMPAPIDDKTTYGQLYESFTPDQKAYTRRDTITLLRQIAYDLKAGPESGRPGSDRSTRFFINGLFDWNAEPVFDTKYLDIFKYSYDKIADIIQARGGVFNLDAMRTIRSLFELVKTSLDSIVDEIKDYPLGEGDYDSPYRVAIPSIVEATGQQLSYAGTGVNYNSLPYTQRGTGSSTTDVFVKSGGGRIYATFATEVGDTYLGEDLRVDFERSTIEGQAFSRGVQNITLPLTIGVGG